MSNGVEQGCEGDLNCSHEWEWDDFVIDTSPPIQHVYCKKCGRVEHRIESEPYD